MDNYQDNVAPREDAAQELVSDADALFSKLKRWFKRDHDSHGQVTWRTEAREDFAFEAGDQLTEDDKNILKEMNRPIVVFNRIGVTVDSVAGQEVANRQEVQFLPRQEGAVKVNELLTSAAKWFRQQCDAEDEESDAFRDTVVCGMGWTETRLDYEDDPEGQPKVDRVDPLEMVWDSGAKKRNLVDARRIFHIRRDVPIDEARALCPGDPDRPFEDADYNATWVDDRQDGASPHENDANFYSRPENNRIDGDADDNTVTLVRAQWWERVPAYLMVDPANPDSILTLSTDEYRDWQQKYKLAGVQMPKVVKTTRKVFRQAYLGNVLLEIGDAPVKGHFSFKCITGKRDRNKNTFFGIVRAMKDPARWSNKWMSQTMHIMNTSAKGGIAVERGQFFDDDADGQSSWAKNDQVTYLKPGALSGGNPKFVQKPVSQFPQSSFELMQFAVQSLPAVSGVNVEMLGMQGAANQAASLDRQRKQAVMLILQPLFDGLRRYRKEQGRLLLFLIENYLSDGRLIKIEGPDEAQFVPLIRQQGAENNQYDVIVDEAPTSANQKELTWTLLQQILPVIGKMLPPATWLALLKYSPLPTSAQKDISDSIQQAQQQPDPEKANRDAELQMQQQKAAADIENHRKLTDAKIESMNREAEAQRQLELQKVQHEALTQALVAPPVVGLDGAPMPNHGEQAAALIMSVLGEMRRDMTMLAQAFNAPKQLIRDPQTGDIVGIAPMRA
ncbi:phage portal protein [Bradyrhizobium sp. SZCCHNS2015]|uniref:portal protein n=1 Tax=Bradyrhizobium sp. SZCCHNS2015 TaxID=3057305 RepID=UPI0028F05DC3|nr:phage portal protein [Bradyrhizobium sp. SZCCHNS2015]